MPLTMTDSIAPGDVIAFGRVVSAARVVQRHIEVERSPFQRRIEIGEFDAQAPAAAPGFDCASITDEDEFGIGIEQEYKTHNMDELQKVCSRCYWFMILEEGQRCCCAISPLLGTSSPDQMCEHWRDKRSKSTRLKSIDENNCHSI